jgi:Caspase domain
VATELLDYQNSLAILVGVAAYQDSRFRQLPAAENSLVRMRDMLTDPALGGWPEARVSAFLNQRQAGSLAADLRDLAGRVQDSLLFYFVGHGQLDERMQLCLALSDTRQDHPDLTGLAYDDVKKILRASPARVKAVILDCCHSGQAIEALGSDSIADATAASGITTLTATDGAKAAHVVRLEQQADRCTSFTEHLLDIVRAGRTSGEPSWTLHDLYQVLRARLLDAGLPAPNIRYTDTAGLFRLARNAALAPSHGHSVSAVDSSPASGSNFALTIWRKAEHVQRDWTGRQYGETGEDENIQLDADRMWWRIARWRMPYLKALVFITDGKVNRIREVYGIDEETTRDGSLLALHVSPPLSTNEVAERLPTLPVTLGSARPAIQGKLREYLAF